MIQIQTLLAFIVYFIFMMSIGIYFIGEQLMLKITY